jgi:hypothetical protein
MPRGLMVNPYGDESGSKPRNITQCVGSLIFSLRLAARAGSAAVLDLRLPSSTISDRFDTHQPPRRADRLVASRTAMERGLSDLADDDPFSVRKGEA